MGVGGQLNNRNAAAAAAADAQLRHHMQQSMHMDSHSPYTIDHHQPAMAHHHPPPHAMAPSNHMAFAPMTAPQHHHMMSTNYLAPQSSTPGSTTMDVEQIKAKGEPAPKAFSCSTCGKGFARRSDLARHERIHSGHRPHACDHPGCGKQFIQRSALTVHARVHTGEKPHMCERCGKPFSDSSSLARHRRIHSGKRPYKCPFANCQKTFTRRTTLTRHQNHHTGTVEQAEAETNAKLALTQPQSQPRSANSTYSDDASRNSTVSPTRPVSISPNDEMQGLSGMQKTNPEFSYMSQSQVLQPHMRSEYHQSAVRSTQPINQPGMTNFTGGPQPAQTMTSHPSSFQSSQPHDLQTTGPNENGASPRMSGMAWGSPNHNGLPSPGIDAYNYHDNSYAQHQMYYSANNLRRPQSTEPEDFGTIRSRFMHQHHLQTGNMPIGEWTAMPMGLHGVKPERSYAN